MVRILAVIVGLMLAATSASAADQWSRGSTKDAPIPVAAPAEDAPFSWTALHVGAHAGYGFINRELTFAQEYEETRSGVGIDGLGGEGLIGGFHLGGDYQLGKVVLRTRVDYDFTDIETAVRIFSGGDSAEVAYKKQDEWMVWAGAGLAISPRTLLYALAGYGETSYELDGDARIPGDTKFEQDHQGYGAAVGIEHAVSRSLSLNLEGQYIAWDKADLIREQGFTLEDETRELRVKAGASLRLGADGIRSPLE